MTDDEIIEVVQAHKDGKLIECRLKDRDIDVGWYEVPKNYSIWNFQQCHYRIKPEPRKPREWWLRIGGINGLEIDGFIVKPQSFGEEIVCVREVIECNS